jgi:aminomethyltransferase
MPLQYRGVVAEHLAVRTQAGLFDVSHLGKLVLEEAEAINALDLVLPGKVASLPEWKAGYNLVLDESAGIIDDIFVYRRPESLILVPNAANTDRVLEVLRSAGVPGVGDARDRWAIIALQGPASRDIMNALVPEANALRIHTFGDYLIEGIQVQAARTGYTGEFGFELFAVSEAAPQLWRRLLAAGEGRGLIPAGLGARDTLRLEMGFPLHGNDISVETNPIEAGLDWVIEWGKEFAAKPLLEKIQAEGPTRKLVGLQAVGREIPRAHYPVLRGDQKVGEVTSGNFSPVLKRGIALAYVEPEAAMPGTMLAIDVRGKSLSVQVVEVPFIKRR